MHTAKTIFCLFLLTGALSGYTPEYELQLLDGGTNEKSPSEVLGAQTTFAERNHTSSRVVFTITNYGMFGAYQDPQLPGPEEFYPGCEYPKGSGILHCFNGALWVGAIVGTDTLVSVGDDGWQQLNEMFPDAGPEEIIRRSNRASDPDFSSDAIADEEYIAEYFDTLSHPAYTGTNPFDGEQHTPLGLKIRQHSYSFGGPPDDDFILLRYTVTNIGYNNLEGAYVGAYFDTDVWHPFHRDGFIDDFAGSRWVRAENGVDSFLVGFAADDDGDPVGLESWDNHSARSVFSATFVDVPDDANLGFNWWFSNDDPGHDWGPRLIAHDRPFGTGAQGTPEGDRNKYYVMSQPENDYCQLWDYVDMTGEGWAQPYFEGPIFDMVTYDTKFLISFGGFDLAPGDSVSFGLAIVLGENLHRNPGDFHDLFDTSNPQTFYNTFDFSDLERNVKAANETYSHLLYGMAGDIDNSGRLDLKDVVAIVNYVFARGESPRFRNVADVNSDCKINLSDIVLLVRYLYRNGQLIRSGCVE